MIVIGVTGFRRSGKNTTTALLAELFGFQQYAFADALRRMALAVDPFMSLHGAPPDVQQAIFARGSKQGTVEWRYSELIDILGYERAKDVPDFRRFLQRLGTEGIRGTFGPNAWVNALDHRVREEQPARITLSDVRFASEAAWVHAQGGLLWRVVRPGVGGDDPHPSEIEIPNLPADREIIARSIEELERAVVVAGEADLLALSQPVILHPPIAHAHTTAQHTQSQQPAGGAPV